MCVVAAGLVAAGFAAAGVEEAGVVQVSDGDGEPLQRCHPSAVLCWSTGLVDRVGGARSCMLATRAVRVLYMYIKLATREGGGVLCCRRGSGFHTH